MTPGAYGVTADYVAYLERLLALHEAESPIAHDTVSRFRGGPARMSSPAGATARLARTPVERGAKVVMLPTMPYGTQTNMARSRRRRSKGC